MDMSILLHASITLLGMGLLFYYFKNRISVTEQKVNLMFQLIQEHEKQSAMRVMQPQQMFQDTPINTSENTQPTEHGLINVSDDDITESNEDSDEDSDKESDEESDEDSDDQRLVYGETLDNPGSEKIIKLNLTGSETTNEIPLNENVEPVNITATLLEHSNETDELENISLSENGAEGDDEDDDGGDEENDSEQFQNDEKTEPLNYKKATVAQLKEL